jgi:hypothetical protein
MSLESFSFSGTGCHLDASSNVSVVQVFCAEQSLDVPFSSAFLIGGTGCFYYRSSSKGSTRFHTSSLTFQGEVRAMIFHLTVFAVIVDSVDE